MKFLLSVKETYRFDTDSEATAFIEQEKESELWVVKSTNVQFKEVKQKGEVVDSYYKVTIEKVFNNEKEPEVNSVKLKYEE